MMASSLTKKIPKLICTKKSHSQEEAMRGKEKIRPTVFYNSVTRSEHFRKIRTAKMLLKWFDISSQQVKVVTLQTANK